MINGNKNNYSSVVKDEALQEFIDVYETLVSKYYDDVDKDYNVVIFLIKLDEEKTFIFQYEIALNDDTEKIFADIKNSLTNIKLVK